MNDNEDELTEAQCVLADALATRIWGLLHAHEPEVVANVIADVLAAFLGNWGHQHTAHMRRHMQAQILSSIAQVAFDLLDIREARRGARKH